MKTKLLFAALFFFVMESLSQTSANLDINNVSAPINAGGDLFWNFQSAGYEVPKGGGAHTIFASNLWIAGYDMGNVMHVAAQTYRQTGNDFWPGPLDTITATCPTAVSTSQQWDRVWKINKTTIDSFELGLFQTIPQIILDWPGNGTGSQAHNLAPYFDNNGDGNYDPSSGDYPIIKGDQAVYFIFNDNLQGAYHTETGGNSFGLEIHAMAYAFKCTSDQALDNTIFLNYKIYNRSPYQDTLVHIGCWTDFDIGLYSDDVIGCDVARQCYYGYNGTSSDGNGGPGTYGLNPPAQAVVFLNGVEADMADGIDNNKNCVVDEPGESSLMSNFIFYNNDATVMGNPSLPFDYYKYLSGKWKDGTPLTYSGSGHQTGQPCSYMFPGNSDQQYGWGLGGDCTSPVSSSIWNSSTVGDIRGLASSGPVTMRPGGAYTLDLAFVTGTDNNGQSVSVMKTRVDAIRTYFQNNITPCGGTFNTSVKEDYIDQNTISIFPNPASDILFITLSGKTKNTIGEIYDVTGKKVLSVDSSQLSEGKVNVNSFANGLYIIRIIDGNKTYSKKFVKE